MNARTAAPWRAVAIKRVMVRIAIIVAPIIQKLLRFKRQPVSLGWTIHDRAEIYKSCAKVCFAYYTLSDCNVCKVTNLTDLTELRALPRIATTTHALACDQGSALGTTARST